MDVRVAFRTLGCKLNQLESESLADAFRRAGARIGAFESEAELYVLNTCTVTSKAEQKARRLVRQALALNPEAVVLVTGCYAQMEPAAIEALGERAVVVPGDEKAALLGLASHLSEYWQGHGRLLDAVLEWRLGLEGESGGQEGGGRAGGADRFAFRPESFSFHSRPSLKIQDGCDNRCTYCRVCLARGPSTSLPATEVLSRLRALEEAGAAEAVLTGVNLSQYRNGSLGFPGLLRLLLSGTERIALRVSSYEPDKVDEAFLAAFAEPRVRPHAHLPIQSGSDPVLARMGRAYRRDAVLAACEGLRRAKGDLFLAADLIVGFPGETDADFAQTLELAKAAGLAWIHAFPFSPRPGTKAWDMGGRVPERVAGERAAALGELARKGRAAYVERWLGAEVDAVLESGGERDEEEGALAEGAVVVGGAGGDAAESASLGRAQGRPARYATSANYLKLRVEGLPEALALKPGAGIRCRLKAGSGEGVLPLADAVARAEFLHS